VSRKKRATLFLDYNSGVSGAIVTPFIPVEARMNTIQYQCKNFSV